MKKLLDTGFDCIHPFFLSLEAFDDFRWIEIELSSFGAAENTLKRIVIPGRNRIELMVVALRARACQGQKASGGNVDTIIRQFGTETIETQTDREFLVFARSMRSPAICAFTKVSYGISSLNALITQSR